jgi:microcystin-dependent protein
LHSHAKKGATQDPATAKLVSSNASFALSQGGGIYQDTGGVQLAPEALAPAGGDQPHNNLMPYLTFYFAIALQGVFPPRG